jgi:Zn-dependent peptidase ImmA (M78 family)
MAARKEKGLPVNPRILVWARERAGRSREEAANHIGVGVDKLTEWEQIDNGVTPTVKQARTLADYYGRSFLEFFLAEIPEISEPSHIPDFRLYRGADDPAHMRELLDIQGWAEAQRINALDLFGELGEAPPQFPGDLFATINSDTEEAAARARDRSGFPIEDQINLKPNDRAQLPNVIRGKIESLGVLTLRRSDLKNVDARGFCIAVFPLPVIVFGSESPAAQAFTLAHEFAHILLQTSAISGQMTLVGGEANARRIEEWCNRFAGAFLLPARSIHHFFPAPPAPLFEISDIRLDEIASRFGVSRHATLIRLVQLRYVRPSFYWEVKKPEFDEQERKYKSFGRARFYGSRYKNALGQLYTSLVMEAWDADRITNHNAAEFMGIKNLAHLRDIREDYEE